MGLLAADGSELPLRLAGEPAPAPGTTRVLPIQAAEERFRFVDLPERPVVLALRGFSAPVKLNFARDLAELAFLFSRDSDGFNRWDAGQQLATRVMLEMIDRASAGQPPAPVEPLLVDAFRNLVTGQLEDQSYWALLLTLPSEEYVSAAMAVIDPDQVHAARQRLKRELAVALEAEFLRLYEALRGDEHNRFDAAAVGRRRLKNTCLDYLNALDNDTAHRLSLRQFRETRGMTDQLAALGAIVNSHHPNQAECLEQFYQRWHAEPLVVDKWFMVQSTCHLPGTLERVRALMTIPASIAVCPIACVPWWAASPSPIQSISTPRTVPGMPSWRNG